MCLRVEKLDYFHSYTHDNGTGTCQTAILCSIQYHFNSPSARFKDTPPVDVQNMAKDVVDLHFQGKTLHEKYTSVCSTHLANTVLIDTYLSPYQV